MFHSRLAEATLIGCLTALASFCALNARAGETYSIVAQSNQSSAATGRRPLSERIAAANLPIIAPTASTHPRETVHQHPAAVGGTMPTMENAEHMQTMENMSVAAVRVDREVEAAPEPPPRYSVTPPVLWPFGTKRTASTAERTSPAKQPVASSKSPAVVSKSPAVVSKSPAVVSKSPAVVRDTQRQANARLSGKGLSSSSPASVTR